MEMTIRYEEAILYIDQSTRLPVFEKIFQFAVSNWTEASSDQLFLFADPIKQAILLPPYDSYLEEMTGSTFFPT